MRHIPHYSLWLGHAGDARDKHELLRIGVEAVVDLAVEEPPAVAGHETVYCRFPLIDGTENLREKVPTLVSCSAGMSRAPAIAAAALVKLGRPDLQDALLYLAGFGPFDVSAGLLQDVVNVTRS
jgi:hypothetical protein